MLKAMKKSAQIFKALSDETRLRILSLLMESELCVCDLMAVLQLPQSTVSRHLAYLKNVGWVDDRREGVWVYYSINTKVDEMRNDLIPLLRKHLLPLETAVADRKRLSGFADQNNCA